MKCDRIGGCLKILSGGAWDCKCDKKKTMYLAEQMLETIDANGCRFDSEAAIQKTYEDGSSLHWVQGFGWQAAIPTKEKPKLKVVVGKKYLNAYGDLFTIVSKMNNGVLLAVRKHHKTGIEFAEYVNDTGKILTDFYEEYGYDNGDITEEYREKFDMIGFMPIGHIKSRIKAGFNPTIVFDQKKMCPDVKYIRVRIMEC